MLIRNIVKKKSSDIDLMAGVGQLAPQEERFCSTQVLEFFL